MRRSVHTIRTIVRGVITLMALVSLLMPGPVWAQDASTTEFKVKAVILFNFAKYVKWPDTVFESPTSNLRLCILGTNPFGAMFDDANGKSTQNRTFEVATIPNASNAADLKNCQIVYVGSKDTDKYTPLLDPLHKQGVLTVSEKEKLGIVNFFIEDSKVKFGISLVKTKDSGLVISSQLLKLAKITEE